MNIAFDFDGVLHKHVKPPIQHEDRHRWGSRNINIDRNAEPTDWFHLNLDKIKQYHEEGKKIYIITARKAKPKLSQWLRNIDITPEIIPDENLIMGQENKVQIIIDLGIAEFYDDSPHHIIDLQQSRDQLPADFKLFLSVPEEDRVIEIPRSLDLSDPDIKVNVERVIHFKNTSSSGSLGGRRKSKRVIKRKPRKTIKKRRSSSKRRRL